MTHTIVLLPLVGDFAHNKDVATQIRQDQLLPILAKYEQIVLNFTGVTGSTQSFIHALIAEPLQIYGKDVLKLLQFKSASPIMKTLISLVIDYSLLPKK